MELRHEYYRDEVQHERLLCACLLVDRKLNRLDCVRSIDIDTLVDGTSRIVLTMLRGNAWVSVASLLKACGRPAWSELGLAVLDCFVWNVAVHCERIKLFGQLRREFVNAVDFQFEHCEG